MSNELREIFSYIDGELFWKPRDRSFFKTDKSCKTWNSKFSGKRAGRYCGSSRYWRINYKGRLYLEHILVWIYHNGQPPLGDIDHIDGNRLNNKIENLRDVSRSINSKNSARRSDNKSGVTGVHQSKSGKWIAQLQSEGKKIYLGRYDSLEVAKSVRLMAAKDFKFHENHGR